MGPLKLKLWSISFPGLPQLRLFNYLCPKFGTGFFVGKQNEFGLVFFIEVVAAIVNLMLGF